MIGVKIIQIGCGDSSYLTVTNVPGARCELAIARSGAVTWDYHIGGATPSDRTRIASIVLTLLASSDIQLDRVALEQRGDLTFKGLIGRALTGLGISVTLQVLDVDQTSFEVYSEICVSNPAHAERGTVRVSDQGTVWWDCQLDDDNAADINGLSLTDIVRTIVSALNPAVAG